MSSEQMILSYLPLVEKLAKRTASMLRRDWEDLKQDGIIGLMKAVEKFDETKGAFTPFARKYILGAIYDSSGVTRDLRQYQYKIYRKFKRADEELTRESGRNPGIDEVAARAGLRVDQIYNAIGALGIAFSEAIPEQAETIPFGTKNPDMETTIALVEAIDELRDRDGEVIRLYYLEGMVDSEVAARLGLTPDNAKKIRYGALAKLRRKLDR